MESRLPYLFTICILLSPGQGHPANCERVMGLGHLGGTCTLLYDFLVSALIDIKPAVIYRTELVIDFWGGTLHDEVSR